MLSRSMSMPRYHASRAGASRRMQYLAPTDGRIFCSTNGCTSFLVSDPATRIATCPICGFQKHLR